MLNNDNEQKYPIYKFYFKWIQDGEHKDEYGSNHKGLRKGRIHNLTSIHQMYKEELTDKELRKKALNMFRHWNKEDKFKNVSQLKINIKFLHYETWCLGWFSHWTFDIGQSDADAVNSFDKFVWRIRQQNTKNGYDDDGRSYEGNILPYYCLMGAEDRYRWSGKNDNDEQTEPPCRCSGCKKNGIIRIVH